ncbi:phage terminase small subunit [Methylohalomonas lacus]|uniref:Phage terminase small subunit n=1 Tax=Methylohalomonas lacus TaxID=398773 RepID=A0AAE3HH68_9GAMM|nr:terminase small subunit [Methylohalomonas lacus]MCS3902211.1 phage terminase small subunit [Methylohalomonas lacus]
MATNKNDKANTSRTHNGIKLTKAQQRFCDAYLADPERNGTRVYKQLHPKVNDKTARANASRMLANANVSAYVEQKEQEIHDRLMAQYEANEDNIIRELSAMAFARLSDFMYWGPEGISLRDCKTLDAMQQAGIVELRQTRDSVSVKLQKREALYLLGQRLGLFNNDGNTEQRVKVYINHDLSAADEQ